jgi:hypothetical protein
MNKRDFKKQAVEILKEEYHINMTMYKAGKAEIHKDPWSNEANGGYICFESKTKHTRINFNGEFYNGVGIEYYHVSF